MKKKILMILLTATLIGSLTGCGSRINLPTQNGTYQEIVDDNRFMKIFSLDGYIYVDKETKVQYLFVRRGYGGGMVLLVNPDGTPKLYKEQ